MPNATLRLLSALLLALFATAGAQTAETGTFDASNAVICRLLDRPESIDPVARLELEFRTSHANNSALIGLSNAGGERLNVLASEAELAVRLAWIPDGSVGNGSDGSSEDSGFELQTFDMTVKAPGVGGGEWHRLTVYPDNDNGSLLLDGQLLAVLPRNFTARFAWNGTAEAAVGGGFRGCLSNVSLDGVARVPLHSQSELLNRTDGFISVDTAASRLPGGGPGCRQDPCPCLPNGACVYQQWNVLQRCNCSRGYEGERCQSEWDTCQHLEAAGVCLNGGRCDNLPGPDEYSCSCTPDGHYLGRRCQSFNHCRDPITCQNGANCTLIGDRETPRDLDYRCSCTHAFTGRNCTDAATLPDTGGSTALIVGITIGVIAILLLLIAAVVAAKVIRDRRRDSGAYKPSQREGVNTRNSVYADQDTTMGMNPVIRPPNDERFI